jgi:hypothetical protein
VAAEQKTDAPIPFIPLSSYSKKTGLARLVLWRALPGNCAQSPRIVHQPDSEADGLRLAAFLRTALDCFMLVHPYPVDGYQDKDFLQAVVSWLNPADTSMGALTSVELLECIQDAFDDVNWSASADYVFSADDLEMLRRSMTRGDDWYHSYIAHFVWSADQDPANRAARRVERAADNMMADEVLAAGTDRMT